MAKLQNNNYIRYFYSKKNIKTSKKKEDTKPPKTHLKTTPTSLIYTQATIPPSDTQKPLKHPSNALKTPLISSNVTFPRLNTIQTTTRCNTNVTRMSHLVFPFSSLELT